MRLFKEDDVFMANGEDIDFSCCKCGHIIQKKELGFHCKTIKQQNKPDLFRLFCEACQDKWNKTVITDEKFCFVEQLNNNDEHCHTRFERT